MVIFLYVFALINLIVACSLYVAGSYQAATFNLLMAIWLDYRADVFKKKEQ